MAIYLPLCVKWCSPKTFNAGGNKCASSKRSTSSICSQNFISLSWASIKSSESVSKKRRMDRISVIFSSVAEKSAALFILSAVPAAISSCGNRLSFAFAAKYSQIFCPICSVKSVSTVFRISSAFNPSKGFSFGRTFNDCRVLAPVFTKSEILRYPSCNCCNIWKFKPSRNTAIRAAVSLI